MKTIYTLVFSILLAFTAFGQDQSNNFEKKRLLKESADVSTAIFEGKVISKNKSFFSNKNQNTIYTSYTIQVEEVLFGTITVGTIEIAVIGGQMERGGETYSFESAHGTGLCTGNAIFFCKPFTEGNSGLSHSNTGVFAVISNVCYNSDGSIDPSPYPYNDSYKSKKELYKDLAKFKSIAIPKEKKSPNVEPEKIKSDESGNILKYEQNVKNYETNLALLLDKIKTTGGRANKNFVATNDITFSLANPTVTGTSPRYFEFDITAAANTSSTYYDGALFRLSYNTSAFGSSIVQNNKVTVTKGTTFNSVTYTDPNVDKIDQTSSVIGVPFNSDFNQKSWTRTLITTSPVQLLHFKIEIQNCGEKVNIDFADQSTTNIFSYYTTTANAGITDGVAYGATIYQNPLTDILCQVVISSFTPRVNGGVGDIVEIKGSGFGDIRGNGQVKFKSADSGGKTYIPKSDDTDYQLWSDKLIRIKMPSRIDSLTPTTPGSGDFIVKSNLGDSAVSNQTGQTFTVYYSLHNTLVSGKKDHAYVLNTNNLGGYTVRLDTSVSNHPDRLGCVKKAMRMWKCYTTINWVIGKDTNTNVASADGVTTLFFANEVSATNKNALAITLRDDRTCSSPVVSVIKSFDIGIKNLPNWWYDTLGTAIPAGKYDFYETITHELGHALGLEHINDDTQVMFYSIQSTGKPRRELQKYTSPVEGGSEQVTSSITSVNSQCGYKDMVPSTGSCFIITEVDESPNNNFSIKIYPNPITDKELNIAFESPKNFNAQIIIYDIVGKEVYREDVQNRQDSYYTHTVNVSDLSSGMYFINLIIDKNKVSTKFVKN